MASKRRTPGKDYDAGYHDGMQHAYEDVIASLKSQAGAITLASAYEPETFEFLPNNHVQDAITWASKALDALADWLVVTTRG